MNKATLAEQAHRILEGGSTTSEGEFDIREIRIKLGQNLDSVLIKHLYDINKTTQFIIPDEFLNVQEVTLTANKVTLPFKPLSLKNKRGIYEVMQTGDCDTQAAIYPIMGRVGLLQNSDSYTMEGYLGYVVTGKQFKVVNGDATAVEITFVESPESMGMEEELLMPSYLFQEALAMTIKDFIPHLEIPEDIKQDNDGQ